ncbi:WD repeat-containing protein [Pseudozyma hubeiensis]|nr:WD repeat-containing protein [Pseudozyma hubeiensis]
MTTQQHPAAWEADSTYSPLNLAQYNPAPSRHTATSEVVQILGPSASSLPRPRLSPSSSSSSNSSHASSDVYVDRPPSPPPTSKNARGFRLPRFSLWGRTTPNTLLSDSINSPPSNFSSDLNKLHISQQRARSAEPSTHARTRHVAADPDSSTRSSSLELDGPMPTLTVNAPSNVPSMTSPRLGSVWRLSGGLFASSASSTPRHDPRHGRPQTTEAATPRDLASGAPSSQFAAWSELLHSPAPPDRSTTLSSVSSASGSSTSRPDIRNVRSHESLRSSAAGDAEPSGFSEHSTIPVPKAIKTKLRSKSKFSQEPDFDNIFLSQELRSSRSSPPADSLGRTASVTRGPALGQDDPSAVLGAEGRRKRASWAPRRSSSPHAVPDRHAASHQINAARSSVEEGEDDQGSFPVRPSRFDRQPSTSSHLTTASSVNTISSHAAESISPRSPRLGSELEPSEVKKPKRSKSISPKRKTYALQFSLDGRYLAAAGSDRVVRVYEVISSPADRADEIELAQMQKAEQGCQRRASSICPPNACAVNRSNTKEDVRAAIPELAPVFKSTPIHMFEGHTGDILDLSWSKNNFLLSCSTDKTAKLWHPNRSECLCTFSTSAIVSSVEFHPTDDRFFVTGGLDGKLRLWNITARRVQSMHDVPGVITAVAFSSSGSAVCIGTHSGSILTFSCTDSLTYINSVVVKSAAASKTTQASKITSIQPIKLDSSAAPAAGAPEYMTVTSNDSRVRIYSIATRRLISRFKSTSYINRTSQIRATASSDSQFIVSGSEDASIHIWSLASNATLFTGLFAGIKRNKSLKSNGVVGGTSDAGDNSTWRSWQAGSGSVRCAIFAPAATSDLLALAHDPLESNRDVKDVRSRIIVSTDDSNAIRIWRSDPLGRLL